MKIKRSKLPGMIAVLLLLFILFTGFYFIQALSSPEIMTKRVVSGEYTQTSRLDFSASLKPNLIYEKESVNSKEVLYSALLERMELLYRFSISPELEGVFGNYSIILSLTPTKGGWEKEIGIYMGELSASSFEISIPLDWEMILAMWKTIENETKYDFGDPNVKFLANFNVKGSLFNKKIEEKFSHTSNITYGKVISFSELNKSKKDAIYEEQSYTNALSVFGYPIEIKNAKFVFGIPFFTLTALMGIFISLKREEISDYLSKRERRAFERKFRKRIVTTLDFPKYSGAVRVLNLKELAKLSYELDKPILKAENTFAVLDGEQLYVHDNDNNIIGGRD
ncbi:MAG: DUF5305 family protein [Archaeoglobaceae archaeon]